MTIQIDDSTTAFMQGITDANLTHDLWTEAGMPSPQADPKAYALWWFYLGRRSADRGLNQQTQLLYLQGVACRAPALDDVEGLHDHPCDDCPTCGYRATLDADHEPARQDDLPAFAQAQLDHQAEDRARAEDDQLKGMGPA